MDHDQLPEPEDPEGGALHGGSHGDPHADFGSIDDLLDADQPFPADRDPLELDQGRDLPDLGPILDDVGGPDATDAPTLPGDLDPGHLDPGHQLTPDLAHDIADTVEGAPSSPDPSPVTLDSDVDLGDDPAGPDADPSDTTPDQPAAPTEVDLSLDDDDRRHAVLDSVDDPSVDDAGPDEIELPTFGGPDGTLDVPEDNAWLAGGLVGAALIAIGVAAPSLSRLRRASPPDVAAHLDLLGLDARVEHLDLTDLEELLLDGRTVLLSTDGSAGVDASAVLHLEAVDRSGAAVVVRSATGARQRVELARFEEAWADSANQAVQASGPAGSVTLIPVVLPPAALATTA